MRRGSIGPERWRHWPLAAIVVLAVPLLFLNLGRGYLWADEGDTAVLAMNVLKFGVPRAWDGATFVDSDLGTRLNDEFVMVSHPWAQYYVAAASFALFGETTFAARFPFALAALTTLIIVYVIVLAASRSRLAAFSSSALTLTSVQFLIYSRQSRHYALSSLFTCLLILLFQGLRSWSTCAAFAATAIVLFHTHPIGVVPVAALGLATLVLRPFAPQRRWFARALPVILLCTLPWLTLAREGYTENATAVQDVGQFAGRWAQFLVECASVTPLVGVALLFGLRAMVIAWRRRRGARTAQPGLTAGEISLALVGIAMITGYAIVVGVTQSRDEIWVTGVRHAPAVIPLTVMLAGMAIARVSGRNRRRWAGLMLVFACTTLPRLTPWTFWAVPTAQRRASDFVTFHEPRQWLDRVIRRAPIAFVRSLFRPNPGTVARVSQFLLAHAAPDDVVITNYEWEPLYFHTRLPQGLKILPSYPIYEAARRQRLPEYVFSAQGVRWIVWRRAWGAYRGQECEKILQGLKDRGTPVQLVASFRETIWENRENIHFRRFSDDDYVYPWFGPLPDTLVFRVG